MQIEPFPEPEFPSQGAFVIPGGGVKWCVWAPFAESVTLVLGSREESREIPLTAKDYGYFEHQSAEASVGDRYSYRLGDGPPRPDPASRWQPDGVNAPSAVFDPQNHRWNDSEWQGVARDDLVIYELHVGSFTAKGTFEAVIPRLGDLRELGITAIEVMPVAQFSGGRNWGYDGVHPYAAQNTYGGPQGLQRLIDAAHQAGLAVILDVIYNHVGPEGNYLPEFGPYFTDRYHTPWGSALNFDGAHCDPVRRYVCDNVRMWVRDFHVDGLRLDAIQTIYDFSARHILADIRAAAHEEADRRGRPVHVIGETNQNDARLTKRIEEGGIALDGVWSDDLHHSVHALLTGEREGYYQDFGHPQHLVKAYNDTFVYNGQYSPFRCQYIGSSVAEQDRSRFVVAIQNHDQIGNRALGERLDQLVAPAVRRQAAALLLLSPNTPLLFMGEEYGETRPFPFFCSFSDPDLVEAVRRGRRQEFTDLNFEWGESIPDPQSEETFLQARLSWSWPDRSVQAGLRELYRDLLAARRDWPALRNRTQTRATLHATAEAEESILEIVRGDKEQVTAIVNLSAQKVALASLLAQSPGEWLLSTESSQYGGARDPKSKLEDVLPHEVLITKGSVQWLDHA